MPKIINISNYINLIINSQWNNLAKVDVFGKQAK